MIPTNETYDNEEENVEFETEIQSSKTYRLDKENMVIVSTCDGLEAIKQAVYKALNTTLFQDAIYEAYGLECDDFLGEDIELVECLVKKRITEALEEDDRIEEVKDFTTNRNKGKLIVTFTVVSTEGEFEEETAVNI